MDALLRQPDRHAVLGMRDYVLLLLLYNSGARADELTSDHRSTSTRRSTFCAYPWERQQDPYVPTLADDGADTRKDGRWARSRPGRLPRSREQTNDSIWGPSSRHPVRRNGKQSDEIPSMQSKRVSLHTIRHTTAVHLLRSGVDINTIRTWLGHVSLGTTNIYAEVDLEMKAKALASVDVSGQSMEPLRQCALPSLMTLLRGI